MHDSSPCTPVASESTLPVFLGHAAATRGDRRLAVALAGALLLAFGVGVPFARLPLPAYPAFAPVYDMAVVVLHALTALLLHAQYRQLGERSLLALVCGYAFTPVVILAHAISFPDAFVPGSAFGGTQTTAWLLVAWRGLFPTFIAAYAWLAPRGQGPVPLRAPSARAERVALLCTAGLAAGAVVVASSGERFLPRLTIDASHAPELPAILGLCWLAQLLALGVLIARTRLRRRLDLWIAVTVLTWLLDLTLSALLVTARYQLGFYFGRVYGLLGAGLVLAALLRETLALYRAAVASALRLAGAEAALRRANDTLEARVAERAAALEAEARERRALARRLASAHEDERKHFARELHDSIGQLVAGLSFAFKAIQSASDLPPAARAPLAEARRLADALGKEVHDLAVRLRPTALDDMGLAAALEQLVAEWSARSGIAADYETVGLTHTRFASEVETTVYRVVQEALTNVAKHARATRAGVVVTRPHGELSVVIEDDGSGFDPGEVPSGRLGLLGMRERSELVGGRLSIESSRRGTTLTLRVPAPGALESGAAWLEDTQRSCAPPPPPAHGSDAPSSLSPSSEPPSSLSPSAPAPPPPAPPAGDGASLARHGARL